MLVIVSLKDGVNLILTNFLTCPVMPVYKKKKNETLVIVLLKIKRNLSHQILHAPKEPKNEPSKKKKEMNISDLY